MFLKSFFIPRNHPVIRLTKRFISAHNYVKNDDLKIEQLTGNDKGILILGLNRLEGRNSFSRSLTENLEETIETVHDDNSIRAVIIKSLIPRVFCSGADLKERLTMSDAEVQKFVNRLRKLMLKIENVPMPVIAAIDGVALGGGLEMALACDIRVASDKAKIGLVETKLAIMPGAGGTQRLCRITGPSIAKELIFTSRILNGVEAKDYGIVNHCVKSNDTEDAAFNKALDIAREIIPNGPIGVRMAKQAINRGLEVDSNSGYVIEELCYSQLIPTKDRIEGLKAFREKRTPNYSGS